MTKKIVFVFLIGILVFAVVGLVSASIIPAADQAKGKSQGPEHSPVIGDNWELESVDFIHYVKPENPGASGKPAKQQSCYKLMGVKWKALPVSYNINPTNSGLSDTFVVDAVSAGAEQWDSFTATELFNDNPSVDYSAYFGNQNFVNAVSFGDYPQDGVIGVTRIWYTRVGKRIVEFDIMFDTDFQWGDASSTTAPVMDLQNIATHELGHGIGLSDVYQTSCSQVTMYGYSSYLEMIKRTLEAPDITGLRILYGN